MRLISSSSFSSASNMGRCNLLQCSSIRGDQKEQKKVYCIQMTGKTLRIVDNIYETMGEKTEVMRTRLITEYCNKQYVTNGSHGKHLCEIKK